MILISLSACVFESLEVLLIVFVYVCVFLHKQLSSKPGRNEILPPPL